MVELCSVIVYNLNESVKLVWRLCDERYILWCRSRKGAASFLCANFQSGLYVLPDTEVRNYLGALTKRTSVAR